MRLFALLLVVLVAACGHGRAAFLAAHVSSPPEDADGLKGASGTLDCPGDLTPQDLGTSDEDGELRAQHVGAVSLACAMNVSKAGYQPYRALLQDVCTALDSGRCQAVDVRVVLAPQPGKTPAPSN